MTMLYGYVENKFGIVSMPLPFTDAIETKKDNLRCLFALILGASYSFCLCGSSSPSIHSLRIFFKNASREFFFGTSTFYGRDRD
jgi:hypothetical protein